VFPEEEPVNPKEAQEVQAHVVEVLPIFDEMEIDEMEIEAKNALRAASHRLGSANR
jgi:hypothetical protein